MENGILIYSRDSALGLNFELLNSVQPQQKQNDSTLLEKKVSKVIHEIEEENARNRRTMFPNFFFLLQFHMISFFRFLFDGIKYILGID